MERNGEEIERGEMRGEVRKGQHTREIEWRGEERRGGGGVRRGQRRGGERRKEKSLQY